MDEGTILVYCCPSIFSLTSPPSQTKCTVQYIQTVCVSVVTGGWNCAIDHILQEFYTLFLTWFRTYTIAKPPQTKMTPENNIKGLVSLNFLRPWLVPFYHLRHKSFHPIFIHNHGQGFGSGSVSGSAWIRINLSCWIRIRIQIADPDPNPGGQKWPTKIEKSPEFSCF
jgi:hypothetical protein